MHTRRSLQSRFVEMFRSNSNSGSPSGSPSGFESPPNGTRGLGITREPDARTRLLESYDRSNPMCGERRCSHGTFSPRPEGAETHTYLRTSGTGYPEVGDAGGASDDPPGSRAESEYMSQMKSSLSALSMNESKKQYAEFHKHRCSPHLAGG